MSKTKAERLALAFSKGLRDYLGLEKVAAIVKANASEPNPNICHSHDFCDSNMIMHAAGVDVLGWNEWNDDDCEVWSEAWDIARKTGFASE